MTWRELGPQSQRLPLVTLHRHGLKSCSMRKVHTRFTASPLQFTHSCSTGFRSEDWNGHGRSLVLCWVTHFCVVFEVCVWIIVWLEDPIMAHYKISNRVSHLLIFLSVGIWYNPWCHVSKQDVQDLQQKYRPTTSKIQQYISLYTWGTFYPCVHRTHLECLLLKSSFFIFVWP